MNEFGELNQSVIAEFHANAGKVVQAGGGAFASAELLLLHSVGARSGVERVSPVASIRDGGDMVITASRGGAPHNPAWYWNLKAHARAEVEVGTETVEVDAREVADEDYARLWAAVTEAMPQFLEYEKKTTRRMPIFRLSPVAIGSDGKEGSVAGRRNAQPGADD